MLNKVFLTNFKVFGYIFSIKIKPKDETEKRNCKINAN